MKKLGFLLVAFVSTVNANEAVEEASVQFSVAHSKYESNFSGQVLNQKNSVRNYLLEGSYTLPIGDSKYFGFSGDGIISNSSDRVDSTFSFDEPTSIQGKSRTNFWQGSVNLFSRDSKQGGLLVGYKHSDVDSKSKVNGISNNYEDSYEAKYIKAEYYLDQITFAAGLSDKQDNIRKNVKTALVKWYPEDSIALYGSVENIKIDTGYLKISAGDLNTYKYAFGGEMQPEYFSSKLNLSLRHEWSPYFGSKISSANLIYYFSQVDWFNSTPALKFTYSHTTQNRDDSNLNGNLLMIAMGFMFDNRISLKDRDRKYLFSTGYQ